MSFIKSHSKLFLVSTFLVIISSLFGIHIYFGGVLYGPFGGVYLRVTDCSEPYRAGHRTFAGPETRFKKSYVQVQDVNWYRDEVETIAQSLWRIDKKLYDDAYQIYRENDVDRTHRFANNFATLELQPIYYNYPLSQEDAIVGFSDSEKAYVFLRSGWDHYATANDILCPDPHDGTPTIPGGEMSREEKIDALSLNLLELSEPFRSRNSRTGEGLSMQETPYVTVNGQRYYQSDVSKEITRPESSEGDATTR